MELIYNGDILWLNDNGSLRKALHEDLTKKEFPIHARVLIEGQLRKLSDSIQYSIQIPTRQLPNGTDS